MRGQVARLHLAMLDKHPTRRVFRAAGTGRSGVRSQSVGSRSGSGGALTTYESALGLVGSGTTTLEEPGLR